MTPGRGTQAKRGADTAKGEAGPRLARERGFCGAATVGARGQAVIPAAVRARLRIGPGDRLLLVEDPNGLGLILCKIDAIRELMDALEQTRREIDRCLSEGCTPR